METPGSGLVRGAQELLDRYHTRHAIAKAYLKGELPEHLAPYVWDVISITHIAEARKQVDRSDWRLEERVTKLEAEVKALQAKAKTVKCWHCNGKVQVLKDRWVCQKCGRYRYRAF